MRTFSKLLGTVLVFLGLLLLMAVYESTTVDAGTTLLYSFLALVVMAIGVMSWIWCDPYEGGE